MKSIMNMQVKDVCRKLFNEVIYAHQVNKTHIQILVSI